MHSSHRLTAQICTSDICGSGRDMRSANLPKTGFPKDFIRRILDITDYLSHLPETQVNSAYCQKYFGSEKWKFYEK